MLGTVKRAAASALLIGMVSGSAIAQDNYRWTLSGASPEGLWSMLGAGTDAALRTSHDGSVVTYQTSGGGLANVGILASGSADLGIVHNIELKVALDGAAPFQEPVTSLRAVAVLYDWAPMQMVITKSFMDEYGISGMQDIAEKKPPLRIAVNQRGNMVQEMNKQILGAYGITYEDIESWGGQVVYAPGGEMANLFNDRRIDMAGNGVFVPYRYFSRVAENMALDILPLDAQVVEKVAAATGADPYVIKSGGYKWLNHEVPTVALSAVLVASDRMSDDDAYNLTRALVINIGKIQEVHKSMAALTPELMASLKVAPYHPGAVKFYREAGLME
ncbi:MAG: ABC transporter substrate-binding protein [Proteobacteria bacterium]|nr:MAG: ABC transporter substrate-binding protein [Pseudomonadota bacterium]